MNRIKVNNIQGAPLALQEVVDLHAAPQEVVALPEVVDLQ